MRRHGTTTSPLTPDTTRSQAWKFRAACVGEDPELFFDQSKPGIQAALEVCERCPVVTECLAEALHQEGRGGQYARYGIRGGMTPEQRFKHPARPRVPRTVVSA